MLRAHLLSSHHTKFQRTMIMDDEPGPELPKNKVLVAFDNNGGLDKKELVSQLFGVKIGEADNILKNVHWKTKYYEVDFDLYVDEYSNWNEWLQEFTGEECADLREALAGLVVVSTYKSELELSSWGLEDAFVVWVNCDSTVGQDILDDINDGLLTRNQETSVEVINLRSPADTNDYGEKIGVHRFKEILDTCRWKNCATKLKGNDQVAKNSEVSLELLLQRMRQARLRHQGSDLDDQEAMQIAEEIANDLMRGEQSDL